MATQGLTGILMVLGMTTLCFTGTGYSNGVAENLLGSAEKATGAIKNNSKYVQKMNELVDIASATYEEIIDMVSSMISEEERGLLEQKIKLEQEFGAVVKIMESVIKEKIQAIIQNVYQILGYDKIVCIQDKLQAIIASFIEKVDTLENKELLMQLVNDLKPATDLAELVAQDIQEKFPQQDTLLFLI